MFKFLPFLFSTALLHCVDHQEICNTQLGCKILIKNHECLSHIQEQDLLNIDSLKIVNISSSNKKDLTSHDTSGVLNPKRNIQILNSEECLEYIHDPYLQKMIVLLKDKKNFRKALTAIYPNFYYRTVDKKDLVLFNKKELPYPIIVKPTFGCESVGVYRLDSSSEWPEVIEKIKKNRRLNSCSSLLNDREYIIEEFLSGQEYAVDGYYNQCGKPVILNIMKRAFSDGYDFSDHVYYTSTSIVEEKIETITEILGKIGKHLDIKILPFHIEFRENSRKELIPLEVNPLRFMGYNGHDLSYYAFGLKNYSYFFQQKEPEWDQILKKKDRHFYGIFFADVPESFTFKEITQTLEENLQKKFKKILEYRKSLSDNSDYFASIFYETDTEEEQMFLAKICLEDLDGSSVGEWGQGR